MDRGENSRTGQLGHPPLREGWGTEESGCPGRGGVTAVSRGRHLAAGSLASLGPGWEWRAGQGGAGCGALGGFRVGTRVSGRGRWGENRAP